MKNKDTQQPTNSFLEPYTSRWPDGVKELCFDQMGRLGIDENGTLYWDGKQLAVQNNVVLSRMQKIWGFAIGAAVIVQAFAAVFQAIAAFTK
jgi:homospermidine synthase